MLDRIDGKRKNQLCKTIWEKYRFNTVWHVNDDATYKVVFPEIDLDEAVVDTRVQVDARCRISVNYKIRLVVVDDARRGNGFLMSQVSHCATKTSTTKDK